MIKSITLLTSSACNLNCSFCYLHKTPSLINYDKEVLQAWVDKTYISTVQKSLIKFNENPLNVNFLQFWGGETLLHIDKITENVQEFYKYFPNINSYLIPTNWTINIEEFFNFLKELDKYANPNTDFAVQLSIDGPEEEYAEQGHQVSFDIYKKNIQIFSNLINNYKLKNIKVRFNIKATISKELYFKKLSTYEGIKNYVSKMSDLISFIDNCFISESCIITMDYVYPGIALPSQETVQDGLKITEINRLWEYVRANEFKNNIFKNSLERNFYSGLQRMNIEEHYDIEDSHCGQLKTGLTFLPDGTIVECSSAYMTSNKQYQQECLNMNDKERFLQTKVHSSLSINPITASDYEIKKFKWAVVNGIRDTEKVYRHFQIAVCQELAKSGQIPQKYLYNKELLNNHLSLIIGASTCMYENINSTKTISIASPSTFRRYLNGLVEYAYDNQKIDIIKQEILY